MYTVSTERNVFRSTVFGYVENKKYNFYMGYIAMKDARSAVPWKYHCVYSGADDVHIQKSSIFVPTGATQGIRP